jgi:hypothetical protein
MKHNSFLLFMIAAAIMVTGCKQSEESAPLAKDDSAGVAEQQVQPSEAKAVDLARWHEMSWQDFDRLFATFAQSNPPVVRDYGICDSITCIFPTEEKTARAEILVCDLNDIYDAETAFMLLGIESGRVLSSEGGWITLAAADARFASLKYKTVDGKADRTQQLLLQFKR